MARNSYTKGSSATRTILSGSRAVDKGTPVHSIVKDTNDESRNEGIQDPPKELAAARQEITALRAANQELIRRSTTPSRNNYRNQRR